MDMHGSMVSPEFMLTEQVARQMFEILPQKGPVLAIFDRNGNFWPNDSEAFQKLNISQEFLDQLCSKIDDGHEPLVTQCDSCSIVATQLATDRTNCGYIFFGLPNYSPESTLANVDLIEIIVNQINLVARLIEKNNQLYELQMKQFSHYSSNQSPSN